MNNNLFNIFEQSLKELAHKSTCHNCSVIRCIYQHNDDEHLCDFVLSDAILLLENERSLS